MACSLEGGRDEEEGGAGGVEYEGVVDELGLALTIGGCGDGLLGAIMLGPAFVGADILDTPGFGVVPAAPVDPFRAASPAESTTAAFDLAALP